MKEWFAVDKNNWEGWLPVAEEAMKFVEA